MIIHCMIEYKVKYFKYNIEELRQEYIKEGYTKANAIAKVCQDLILYEISKSPYYKNITIKGGVVIHSLSKNKRRATQDIDLDFIKYSLEDKSIKNFISKLNDNNDGIQFTVEGKIEYLHHQDYNGKRINIIVKDIYNNIMRTKLDIGVHNNFDLAQEEYCFCFNEINTSAKLFINSTEQILLEKLKSLLKFGVLTTRYKDIFDIYFLINNTNINNDKINRYLKDIIYNDKLLNINNINDIINKLNFIFKNNKFINNIQNAKNNWLEIQIDDVLSNIFIFFNNLR